MILLKIVIMLVKNDIYTYMCTERDMHIIYIYMFKQIYTVQVFDKNIMIVIIRQS